MPGVLSWPARVHGPARESWATLVTMDFLATVAEAPGGQEQRVLAFFYFVAREFLIKEFLGLAVCPRS